MDEFLSVYEMEAQTMEAGFRVADLCRRAGVSRSIFARWKEGREITMRNYKRLRVALDYLASEKAKHEQHERR